MNFVIGNVINWTNSYIYKSLKPLGFGRARTDQKWLIQQFQIVQTASFFFPFSSIERDFLKYIYRLST